MARAKRNSTPHGLTATPPGSKAEAKSATMTTAIASRSRKQAVAGKSGLKAEVDLALSAKPASRRDKKGVLIYVSPAVSKQLRGLAIDKDTTVQALGIEAINLLLAHYRLKPIA